VGGRNEREGRYDHLAAEVESPDGNFQRGRGVAGRDAVLDPAQLSDALFELLHEGPVVREPTPVEQLVHPGQQSAAMSDVRASDVKPFREHRQAPEDRKVRS
jgi:hypothetical protein